MAWQFTTDPQEFLDRAERLLGADPVIGTVPASMAAREIRDRDAGAPPPPADRPRWYALWLGTDAPSAAAMRTAPFAPYPIYLMPMPPGAATDLAEALHADGQALSGATGSEREVEEFATAAAQLQGRRREVEHHDRLFRLDDLVEPRPVTGFLRPADEADLDRMAAWFGAFMRDADEQAGRVPGSSSRGDEDRDALRRRLPRTWFWDDGAGHAVSMVGANLPAFGVARIGPVYSPPEVRGRGYASAAVAEVSRRILVDDVVPCLFTDQANPTSNHIYTALGFTPVVDMLTLRLPLD